MQYFFLRMSHSFSFISSMVIWLSLAYKYFNLYTYAWLQVVAHHSNTTLPHGYTQRTQNRTQIFTLKIKGCELSLARIQTLILCSFITNTEYSYSEAFKLGSWRQASTKKKKDDKRGYTPPHITNSIVFLNLSVYLKIRINEINIQIDRQYILRRNFYVYRINYYKQQPCLHYPNEPMLTVRYISNKQTSQVNSCTHI